MGLLAGLSFTLPAQETAPEGLHFPINGYAESTDDLLRPSMGDLRQPDNLKTVIEYDVNTGDYLLVTKLGNSRITSPVTLTEEEYTRYWQQRQTAAFFKKKNRIDYSKKKDEFSLTDIQFDLGAAEKIFGPGGVQIRTQGAIEVKLGVKNNIVNNPTLSERQRNRTYFDFDQQIQLSMNGKVGDKINVNMNYDTEAAFDFDSKSLKLRYAGKEDEIIRSLEAGNVSMPVKNSLITGASSLFGLKTELQFGKLSVAAVISQQNTQTTSASMEGGKQTTAFEISADAYDANRHFFLSHYFREHYDTWMSKLPYISSGIVITKIEVWITNKRAKMDNARNIVAFADLAEPETIHNSHWIDFSASTDRADNSANRLYSEMVNDYAGARTVSAVTSVLEPLKAYGIECGADYERLESARLLTSSEYKINTALGYLTLNTALNDDEILAVAYEYTQNGQTFQVGEFSTDGIEQPGALFVKLLKGTDVSPGAATWDLMMKNVYALGCYSLPKEDFLLNIAYLNDSLGTAANYLPEGKLSKTLLLKVMNLDRLNSRNEAYPDGKFDFVDGYTVQTSGGRIIFPVIEPFGSHLASKLNDPVLADKYCFQELYDSTLVVAQEMTEKNKFRLTGEYRAANAAELSLGTMNVTRGSVKVTAGGRTLTENVDYIVDYISGTVTITNQEILSSGATINATCEDQGVYNMVRKTFAGIGLEYKFNDHFTLGGTLMHLSEQPLTNKVDMNTEPLNNTVWGLHTAFDIESQGLTKLIDKLPLINVTEPSRLTVKAEFAQLIPGSSKQIDGTVYVDDFEGAKKSVSLRDIQSWHLSGTPYNPSGGLFPEAALSNDLNYGKNRARLAWYCVDNIFTQSRSQTPDHLRNNDEALSNHFVRAVNQQEIYPDKSIQYNETGLLTVMNLAFYPKERGPYNFDTDGMNADGTLAHPEGRWGGIMRKIESNLTNFEANNVEYIEFWLMDPFIYDTTGVNTGGDLYFDLGALSEDVLKDGKRSFENGLPTDGDTTVIDYTVWGKVSKKNVTVYAFDNTDGVRKIQDVGLDGLTDSEEQSYFRSYVNAVENRIDASTRQRFLDDPFSPLNDPAGDNYHYYRGTDYDRVKKSILDRYKYYNGPDGNSQARADTDESYETAATTLPDIEDINQDFTLNENEKYYQYKVSLRPQDLVAGTNYINDVHTASVKLKNNSVATVKWYQFKIPVKQYDKRVGNINGLTDIRFMRMFLHGWQDSVVLRFATLELVRGDWRVYTKDLYSVDELPVSQPTFELGTIGLEENSSRTPIHYTLPPGVERETDPTSPGIYEQDEKSLDLKVRNLSPGDARAAYRNTSLDFRQYDRLQMFVHAEAMEEEDYAARPADYEMSVFLRLGSDNQNNYYEYEIPLKISPPNVHTDRSVWPDENFMDIDLSYLTELKTERNAKAHGQYNTPYSIYDPDFENHKITVKGNPSLSEVKTVMIGIRNRGAGIRSVEVWADELRLKGFNDQGGWAAMANANLAVSDLGNISFSGHYETDGFGGIEQRVSQRRLDTYGTYNLALSFDLGKLLPKRDVLHFPIYYSVSKQVNTPKYDPLNQDLLLSDVLDAAANEHERDSIKNYSQKVKEYRSLSLSNIRLNVKSKTPMPYDPANFGLTYGFNETLERDVDTEYEITRNYNGGLTYGYSSPVKPFEPFAQSESEKLKSPWLKAVKEFSLTYLPNSLSFNTNLTRYYYELQNRDLNNPENNDLLPVNVSKNFLWNTDFSLTWNFTKNMKFSFSTNNSARVEETKYAPVNQELYPTEFQNWKDTVWQSIKTFGTPMQYQQNMNFSWQIPFKNFPALDFLTAGVQYNTSYHWDRSAEVEGVEQGNTISNQRTISVNPAVRLETLYNKVAFLEKANKRFQSATSMAAADKKQKAAVARKKKLKPFEQKLTLLPDTVVTVKHGWKNKRVDVRFVAPNGEDIRLRYKVVDENNIQLSKVRDTTFVRVIVSPKPSSENEDWYKGLQTAARVLMMVRDVSVSYQRNDNFTLPGFRAESGLFIPTDLGHAPGWDFATGFYDADAFLRKSINSGWLVMNDSVINPSVQVKTENIRLKASVQPFPGIKIDLSAQRNATSNLSVQYMVDGMPEVRTGTFSMSTIAIATALAPLNADESYYSKAFETFLANRDIVAGRLEQRYGRLKYPGTGFLKSSALAGQAYDKANGSVDPNSAEVLIPAFLAAYTGQSAETTGLDLIPSLLSILPNWSLSYDGLSKIPALQDVFQSFTLTHGYTCTYNIGSYTSYNSYVKADGELGFVKDVTTGQPVPSSPYNITGVSLTESFNPLIGCKFTLKNGLGANLEYRNSRSLNLSITGGQLVESGQQQFVVGGSYQLADFHPWGILSESKVKNDLKLSANFSLKNSTALLRKITEAYTQATSGNKTVTLELMADYVVSRSINFKFYYNLESSIPLVSSYPVTSQDFGISLRYTLSR